MFLVPKPSGNPGFVLTILDIIIRRNRMTIIKVKADNCQFIIKYFKKFPLFSVGEALCVHHISRVASVQLEL